MLNVFTKTNAEELYVQLYDGRMMSLEDLVNDYERRLKEESSKKPIISEPKDDKPITAELKVGEWFRIDRNLIAKKSDEICRKCNEAGAEGKKLWKRFAEANEIADKNPDQYPRLIETYIFQHNWEYKTEHEMREMCQELGDGMCDEVICYLELQMRICNGENVGDLAQKDDKLPRVRVIKLRKGGTGYFGGGTDNNSNNPPAYLYRNNFNPNNKNYNYTPYAFRRVLS